MNKYVDEVGNNLFSNTSNYQEILDVAEDKVSSNNIIDQEQFWISLIAIVNSWPTSGCENYGVSMFNKQINESREKIKQVIALKMNQAKNKEKK
ncbi:hypothetical protein [Proteus mirabilis]|uniref:hypothetical protein n=1 Tax=Proteus mirabilis TaxID=584 RepID=UPI00217D806C|nr:hypothetical protein [Proteus mirabilis]MCS6724286.1 hypothetical protein [Proteus mirabilis]